MGSVLILGLGALAVLTPYPWFQKFLTCDVRLLCWLSIGWSAVLLFEILRSGGDLARTVGAIVIGLVMAVGFWMLRKASDAQILQRVGVGFSAALTTSSSS